MSDSSRRSFLKAAAGCAAYGLAATPAMAGMRPIYEAGEAKPLSGWGARVETNQVIQPPQPVGRMFEPIADEVEQRLFIKVQRTGEVFNDVFRQGPLVYQDALVEIDHLMRDWRRDEVKHMDEGLIELLASVQAEIGYDEPLTIVSGYRSPETNKMLRRRNRKVAKNSFHMKGMAVDVRPGDVSTRTFSKLSRKMHAGGVGYYPRNGFVHLDTGPVRSWRG